MSGPFGAQARVSVDVILRTRMSFNRTSATQQSEIECRSGVVRQ